MTLTHLITSLVCSCLLCVAPNVYGEGLLSTPDNDTGPLLLAVGSANPAAPAPPAAWQNGNGPSRKSPGRAFLLSMLAPGLGEWYAGGSRLAPYFIGLEAGLWMGFSAFRMYSGWLSDDYRTFAAQHAGAPEGMNKQYYVDIGNFDTIWEYNEFQGYQRYFEEQYPETEAYAWQWDTADNRAQFKSDRVESDRAYNRSTTVLTVIVINHLCSALNAAISARQWNRTLPANAVLRLEAIPPAIAASPGASLVVTIPFR